MLSQRTFGERLFDIGNVLALSALSLLTAYPFLYVLIASLSNPSWVVQQRGILLFPQGINIDAYLAVLQNPSILTGYANTLIIVVGGTALNIAMTSFGAYVLSRQHFIWRNQIMFAIIFTMFFNGGLIPTFLLVSQLGLLDTRWALILPVAMSAYNLVIMRTAFLGVPVELEESAKLDGANDFSILFRIVLPLSMPVVAVMILFYGVAHWNSWFNALIYIRTRDLYPLQLILREILIANNTDSMMTGVGGGDKMPVGETIKYATIITSTIPILCLYPFLQKYFVKGVMIGAIKG